MTNQQIIGNFECGAIDPESFRHADHVRLAFAYLSDYPPLVALERFTLALQRFAAAAGKADLYNETITYACFFLIRERKALCPQANWDQFAQANPDLLIWKDGILCRYYQPETLQSDFARKVFVLPDKFL